MAVEDLYGLPAILDYVSMSYRGVLQPILPQRVGLLVAEYICFVSDLLHGWAKLKALSKVYFEQVPPNMPLDYGYSVAPRHIAEAEAEGQVIYSDYEEDHDDFLEWEDSDFQLEYEGHGDREDKNVDTGDESGAEDISEYDFGVDVPEECELSLKDSDHHSEHNWSEHIDRYSDAVLHRSSPVVVYKYMHIG